jgi:preprotein translocase subunit Sss1
MYIFELWLIIASLLENQPTFSLMLKQPFEDEYFSVVFIHY